MVNRESIQNINIKKCKELLSKENIEYIKKKNITLAKALILYKKGANMSRKESYLSIDEYYTRIRADEEERKYFHRL